jgi:hypothetical protein
MSINLTMVLHWKQSFDGSGIVCLGNSAGDSEPYKCEYVLTNQTGRNIFTGRWTVWNISLFLYGTEYMVGKLGSFMDTTSLKPDNAFYVMLKQLLRISPEPYSPSPCKYIMHKP